MQTLELVMQTVEPVHYCYSSESLLEKSLSSQEMWLEKINFWVPKPQYQLFIVVFQSKYEKKLNFYNNIETYLI